MVTHSKKKKNVVMKMDSVKTNNYPADEAWSLGLKDMLIVRLPTWGLFKCSTNSQCENVYTNVTKARHAVLS